MWRVEYIAAITKDQILFAGLYLVYGYFQIFCLWNNFVNGEEGVWLISYLYFIFPNTLQTHFKHPATPLKHP